MSEQNISADRFERECESRISGWIWDETFNPDYQEAITITVGEMRYISNLMRRDQKLPKGYVTEWSEDLELKCKRQREL